jgi:AcrR family transcriptional regulator
MARPSCKSLILDAAEAVVLEHGAGRLTLDAAAEKAGVSKGGLLYHFPSKESLIEGMIGRLVERSHARRDAILATTQVTAAERVKAEIRSLLVRDEAENRVSAALLAVVSNEPKLMAAVKEFQRQRFEEHAPGSPGFERKALLLLAADGLFFLELLQTSPFSAEQRQAILEELLEVASEWVNDG